jgi:cytosine/adenosine deaminase-related metal-dependent hydrolase
MAEPLPIPADLLVVGGHVLTMDEAAPEFADGAVAIAGGRIVCVGPRAELQARFRAAATLDATGCAVLPGLVDAYAHAGHGLIRGIMHPRAGWPAFPLYWHRTTPEWWRAEADLAALERLMAGVTTGMSVIGATPARADDPVFAAANAQAYAAAGLRLVLGIGPPDPVFPHLPTPFAGSWPQDDGWSKRSFTTEDAERVCGVVITAWHGAAEGRIRVALAPPYLFGRHVMHRRQPHRLPDAADVPAMLDHALRMRAMADQAGVAMHTHMFRGSVDFAERHFGRAHVARLLHGPVTVAHANGLAPDECRVLGEHGVGIATVAATHENLWYGAAPIAQLVRAGCAVGVSTDGAAPYTSLDLWREPARTALLQWQSGDDQAVLPPETLLRMITIDAARALGIADQVGSLSPGKQADIAVLDLSGPHLGPVADLPMSLVFYAAGADVRDVVCQGRVLLRDRRPLRADAAAIGAAAREHAARALAQVDLSAYRRAEPGRWSGRIAWR